VNLGQEGYPGPGHVDRRWDGQRWIIWNGASWVAENAATVPYPSGPQPGWPPHSTAPSPASWGTPAPPWSGPQPAWHDAAGSPPPASWPMANHQPIDSSRAWLLAAVPVLQIAVEAGLLYSGNASAVGIGVFAAIALNTIVAIWDSRYLRSRGYRVSMVLGLLLMPVYLYRRAKTTQTTQGPFVAWLAALIVAVAGGAALESQFVTMDMNRVEQAITTDIDQKLSTSATVTCPSKEVYRVGSTFTCTAADGTGSALVEVHIENNDADITWRVIGG
jgi:hypothetical protein